MALKRFAYKSNKTQAKAVITHAEGRRKELPGFEKRLVLGPQQVKKVRAQFKLTQKDFAQLLNVDVTAVQNWEQGRRSPDGPVTALMLVLPKHPQLKTWLEQAL